MEYQHSVFSFSNRDFLAETKMELGLGGGDISRMPLYSVRNTEYCWICMECKCGSVRLVGKGKDNPSCTPYSVRSRVNTSARSW